jgi:hypothetical protein
MDLLKAPAEVAKALTAILTFQLLLKLFAA